MARQGLIAIGVVVLLGLPVGAAEHTTDSLEMVKKAIADGKAILCDVREKAEWDAGHVDGAALVPLSALVRGVMPDEKSLPKAKIVYCHCGSGVRCLKAADVLKKLGYDVRPLKPGYAALIKAGFPKAER